MYLLLSTAGLAAAVTSAVVFLGYLMKQGRRQTETSTKTFGVVHLKHDVYFGSFRFFYRPAYFLSEAIEAACDAMVAFKIRSNNIIILRGLAGRDAFYSKVYPQLMRDTATLMTTSMGEHGTVDLFDALDQIIFALAVRLGSCVEFSEDSQKIKKLRQIFKDLEAGSSPSAILFPSLPTPSRISRTLAGIKMYNMINEVIQARKRHDRREDDTLQALIDGNYSPTDITRFIATLIFAAISNTGNTLGWVLVHLEKHPDVKDQVIQELQKLSLNPEIYMEDFEGATPSIEPCINETLRLVLNGTFVRKNIGDELIVDGVRIQHGTYLMYPTTDLHFHPRFYPNPYQFDPMRFDPQVVEERKEAGLTFLAWGAARHICTGKRSAILLMKMVLVQLATYDFTLVDSKGSPLENIPPPAYDTLFKVCQPGRKDRVFLKYQKRR
ncbi:hypothetical protein Clacol_004824 [Clathrus columnatus]|uniref:Cytochrome P450 n=1 Tax=Clathrus columnatus TaxID=1419009 RepID=A0AAV5AA67_9AGAM|nr:hypothetical protein Clacol_004824 [Clathrus columnatus]